MGSRRLSRRALAAAALLAGAAAVALVAAGRHGPTHRTTLRAGTSLAAAAPAGASAPRLVSGPHDAAVPILMYHVISAPSAGVPYPELFVSASDFTGQMGWLARHGYHGVTLKQVFDYWQKGYALPRRPVVITFDDGYISDESVGLRVLHALRWPGVLNLEVRHLRSAYAMPAWRVRKLIAAGWEIDAHTITHPDLTTVSNAQLWTEVAGSRAAIRRIFHVPVSFFCYPAGRYDARVIDAVRRAGYLAATTTNYGAAHPGDLYTLARIRVDGSDGVRGFARKLEGLRPQTY